jgi:hypothetical protein
MSQRDLESVLGRLLTDMEFRARFYAAPADACGEDIVLSPRETAALLRIDPGALDGLALLLDPQIVRAASLPKRGSSMARGIADGAGERPPVRSLRHQEGRQ